MPIEVKELVIRAVVSAGRAADPEPAAEPAEDRRRLIEECVRQVLRILERSREPLTMRITKLFKLEKLVIQSYPGPERTGPVYHLQGDVQSLEVSAWL